AERRRSGGDGGGTEELIFITLTFTTEARGYFFPMIRCPNHPMHRSLQCPDPISFQLGDRLQRGFIGSFEFQVLLEPAVAIETRRRVECVRGIIELHLLVLGAEAVEPFLCLLPRD